MRFASLLFVAVAAAFSCNQYSSAEPAPRPEPEPVNPIVLGETFGVGHRDKVVLESEELEVALRAVDDARCPAGPGCDPPGNAAVEVAIGRVGTEAAVVVLNTNPDLASAGSYGGYELRLVGLEPAAAGAEIAEADYVARLVVTRAAPSPGRAFALRLGEKVSLDDGLELEFTEVFGDSRCPLGVECIWEGNAEIGIRAAKSGQPETLLRLNSNPRFATEATYLEYTIRLLNLDPYPVEGRERDRPYSASLEVTRSGSGPGTSG